MAPNLFLATQKVFSPQKWFRASKSERPTRKTEEWNDPVPGRYEYVPGRGWYLLATLHDAPTDASESKTLEGGPVLPAKPSKPKEYITLDRPIPVVYSKAAKRNFLEPEYKSRKRSGMIKNERGKQVEVSFFRVDDVAWVQCWDEEGTFIPGEPGGYKKWCLDPHTKQFRHMLKRDDPNFVRSRQNSPARDADSRSQQSMSTEYRSSRPGSLRNGPSTPSTRANSIRPSPSNPASRPGSQRPSRQSSPRRNNSVPLEEAKVALRRLAREHEEAVAAVAAARQRTYSKDQVERIEQFERGRSTAPVSN